MKNGTPETAPPATAADASVPPATEVGGARGDRYIRASAVVVVVVLAAVAMFVSYLHQYELAIGYGEPAITARLFPIVIDGVIIMASLIMLYCARLRLPVPPLARFALWAGILATLAANAAHGWSGGTGSRLVSAAPAAVLVIAYELLMWLIRTMRQSTPEKVTERVVYRDVPVEVPVEVEVKALPVDRFEAARWIVEDAYEARRRPPGRRTLVDRWGLEVREAAEILEEVKQEREKQPPSDPSPEPSESPAVPPADDAETPGTERHNDGITLAPINGTAVLAPAGGEDR